MNNAQPKSILAGVMITAGSTIGAGMFSLPVVASGMWFLWSIIVLLALWLINYLAALAILEINLQFHQGSSFDTFVKAILGKAWNIATGVGIAFLLYILLYAYFSGFGNMAGHTLTGTFIGNMNISNGLLSLLFGGLLSLIVWKSTFVVGRISSILVVGMVVAFVLSMAGLTIQIDVKNLFDTEVSGTSYAPYVWASFPYFLTAFGFASIVPSLYKYYGDQPVIIKRGLLYGSLIALLVYTLFLMVTFGIIPRNSFEAINATGGNMGTLVAAMTQNADGTLMTSTLTLFSNFAIISSFLGVGLSLFDYIADRFKFPDNPKGRFYATCITFIPPGLASFFFPNGFIAAIGFAGLVMVFSYFLVPFMMLWKTRKIEKVLSYQLPGGYPVLFLILGVSLLVVICHVLAMLHYLPKY